MARYAKVDVRIWDDEKVRGMSPIPPCGQGLWIRLLVSRHRSSIPGLLCVGEAALAEEFGWSPKAFREAFAEALAKGLVKADWKARLVWLPNACKYNPPESPNVVKSWRVPWDETPECSLKSEAFRTLKAFIEGLGEGFRKAFVQALGEGLPNQDPDPEQEQEQEQEQETDTAAKAAVSSRSKKPVEPTEGFLKFWEAYPRKTAKGQALKAWPGDELAEKILAALSWQVPTWGEIQYVKHPATWLNARCWEDEKPSQSAGPLFSRPQTRDVRHGMIRAEDCNHEQTGEVKL